MGKLPSEEKSWPGGGELADQNKGKSKMGNRSGLDMRRIRAPKSETKDYSDAGNGGHEWGDWGSGPDSV